ncbi:MAG: HAD family hydrolase [Clostridia bacterium]|nr:HAD family hydrolase [Clostridia bacterium]
MRQYDTIIWDLDGTLLNTLEDLKNAVNYSCEKLGYATHSLEEIRTFVGNGVKRLMELSIPDGRNNPNYDLSYDYFNEYYIDHSLDNTKPYEGVTDTINKLREMGVKQAIVSNKIDYAVKTLNDNFFQVDIALGVTDDLPRKPAPDMVHKAMDLLHANPETTVYIGDSEVDLKTAENSNLDCISVLWGFRKREEIELFKPMCMVETPDEILKYIK